MDKKAAIKNIIEKLKSLNPSKETYSLNDIERAISIAQEIIDRRSIGNWRLLLVRLGYLKLKEYNVYVLS